MVFEEPNSKIYRYVRGDIDIHFMSVNIIFHKPVNIDIGIIKQQYLYING